MYACACSSVSTGQDVYKRQHQRAAGEEQVVGRGRVDVVAVGGEAALDPAQQQLAVLLAELHLAHMLIERRDELFHLAVALIGHEVIDENHRAVLRNIRDDLDERAARGHIELEDVQIRHRDERVLRHHGHGLHGLLQRLHRKPLAAETVVVDCLLYTSRCV